MVNTKKGNSFAPGGNAPGGMRRIGPHIGLA